MSKFPRIHCSDIEPLKKALKAAGFKKEEICQDEVVRMKHPDKGVAIVWRKPRNTPFQKVNLVAAVAWDEYQPSRDTVE